MNDPIPIPKAALEHGVYYEGHCRNATVARWNAAGQEFVHWRSKFGHRFTETIKHPDDDAQYDVFIPEKRCEDPKEVIPFETDLLPETRKSSP